jgi:hypothetical protein
MAKDFMKLDSLLGEHIDESLFTSSSECDPITQTKIKNCSFRMCLPIDHFFSNESDVKEMFALLMSKPAQVVVISE